MEKEESEVRFLFFVPATRKVPCLPGILAIVYYQGMSFRTFPVIYSDEDIGIKRLTEIVVHVHKLQKKGLFLCVK